MKKVIIRIDEVVISTIDEKCIKEKISRNKYLVELITNDANGKDVKFEEIIRQNKQLNFNINILLESLVLELGEKRYNELKTNIYRKISKHK